MITEKIISASDILQNLKIPDNKENERILSTCLTLFNYLRVGETIKTSYGLYKKLDPQLIYMESEIEPDEIVNTLEVGNIIKVTV